MISSQLSNQESSFVEDNNSAIQSVNRHPQVENRTRRIRIFRNGDMFHPGKKMVVSGRVFRNWEQLLHTLSSEIDLKNGAVRKIYNLQGRQIHGLHELEENENYVASSGESFKKVPYPILANMPDQLIAQMPEGLANKAANMVNDQRRRLNGYANNKVRDSKLDLANKPKEKEIPIFTSTTKAYRVAVFPNGEFDKYKSLVLNYRNCRSFDQLLRGLTELLQIKGGYVRKLFDAETGQRIKNLQDLRNGQNIVCAGHEPFQKLNYQTINLVNTNQKKIEKTELPPKIITLFPNGDQYHGGWTLSLKQNRYNDLPKFLEFLNKQNLPLSHIKKIYATDGTPITSLDQIESGSGYVLVPVDAQFQRTQYNVNQIKILHTSAPLAGATINNELMDKIRKPAGNSNRWPKAVRAKLDRENSNVPNNSDPKANANINAMNNAIQKAKELTHPKEAQKPKTEETVEETKKPRKSRTNTEEATPISAKSKQRSTTAGKVDTDVSEIDEDENLKKIKPDDDTNDVYESENIESFVSKGKSTAPQKTSSHAKEENVVHELENKQTEMEESEEGKLITEPELEENHEDIDAAIDRVLAEHGSETNEGVTDGEEEEEEDEEEWEEEEDGEEEEADDELEEDQPQNNP
ncbi:hypothetical protein HK098_007649 [Nowakowskiella sp. JEL0407]|nr:hypothetical protein HK098_007649 [Nowakowskiella sp. JEL0407]